LFGTELILILFKLMTPALLMSATPGAALSNFVRRATPQAWVIARKLYPIQKRYALLASLEVKYEH